MEFTRKKKRGMDQRFAKVWFSDGHEYRITWACKVFGVSVTPHYHACVLSGDRYDFAGRRGPYKKLNTAVDACEKHRKVWEAAIEIVGERKGRTKRLEALFAKTGTILRVPPAWAEKSHRDAVRMVNAILFPAGRRVEEDDECQDQPDPSNPSNTTESPSPSSSSSEPKTIQASGLASTASGEAGTTTRTKSRTRLKATNSDDGSAAPPAKAPAKGRGRRAKQPTVASSPTGDSGSKSSTRKKRSAKAA